MSAPVPPTVEAKMATRLTSRPAFQSLTKHFESASGLHLRDLFATDPKRSERFSVDAAGLFLDYSKNRITDETMALLFELARQSGVQEHIAAMFAGEKN